MLYTNQKQMFNTLNTNTTRTHTHIIPDSHSILYYLLTNLYSQLLLHSIRTERHLSTIKLVVRSDRCGLKTAVISTTNHQCHSFIFSIIIKIFHNNNNNSCPRADRLVLFFIFCYG